MIVVVVAVDFGAISIEVLTYVGKLGVAVEFGHTDVRWKTWSPRCLLLLCNRGFFWDLSIEH
jgi:hypothetical protein